MKKPEPKFKKGDVALSKDFLSHKLYKVIENEMYYSDTVYIKLDGFDRVFDQRNFMKPDSWEEKKHWLYEGVLCTIAVVGVITLAYRAVIVIGWL